LRLCALCGKRKKPQSTQRAKDAFCEGNDPLYLVLNRARFSILSLSLIKVQFDENLSCFFPFSIEQHLLFTRFALAQKNEASR
jgi:hypothetical protein